MTTAAIGLDKYRLEMGEASEVVITDGSSHLEYEGRTR
jgi:hypothetical protein